MNCLTGGMWPYPISICSQNLLGPLDRDIGTHWHAPLINGCCVMFPREYSMYPYVYHLYMRFAAIKFTVICCLWMKMELETLALVSLTYHEQGPFRCINWPRRIQHFTPTVVMLVVEDQKPDGSCSICFFGGQRSSDLNFLGGLRLTLWESIRH